MDSHSGLFIPPFDELSDPSVLVDLAGEAEDAGWDGIFLWDHVNYRPPVRSVADPWIALAAIAARTHRVRLGALVTPLARRRPHIVARQTATLDQLSGGRLIFGAGLGRDRSGRELSAFGEEMNDLRRAEMLDESLNVITSLWTGAQVDHAGSHYRVDAMTFLPTPVQRPRVPIWIGGRGAKPRPAERAARWDGYFPVDIDSPDEFAACVQAVTGIRHDISGFDFVAEMAPDGDPAPWIEAGATWWLASFGIERLSASAVRERVRAGPTRLEM